MSSGITAQAAADHWLSHHADEFGINNVDLIQLRTNLVGTVTGNGSKTVFAYQQCTDGTADGQCSDACLVDAHAGRILVRQSDTACFEVIYAAALLMPEPPDGCTARAGDLTGKQAKDIVRQTPAFSHLPEWEVIGRTLWYGGPGTTACRAWKIAGWDADIPEAYTFFVNVADGTLADWRSDVHNFADVTANVTGYISAPPGPFKEGAVLTQVALPNMRVQLATGTDITSCNRHCSTTGGNDWDITSASGTVVLTGTTAAKIRADVKVPDGCPTPNGPWINVVDCQPCPDATPLVYDCENALPPSTVPLVLNDPAVAPTPNEFTTAQINCFYHATAAYNFYQSREPFFVIPDLPLTCRVNRNEEFCRAQTSLPPPIQDRSMLFSRAALTQEGGLPCRNTASESIVVHEFGHFLLYHLGVTIPARSGGLPLQFAFGEGFGDALALMVFDEPRVGLDWCQVSGYPVTSVRDYDRCGGCGRVLYPCTVPLPCGTEVCYSAHGNEHGCGKLLAGVWWDVRRAFAVELGSVQQLFADWSQITLGSEPGNIDNSAHPLTAIEVLTADDTDGDLSNGTPHECKICDAFTQQGIPCPACNGIPERCELTTALGGRYLAAHPGCGPDPIWLKVERSIDGLSCEEFYVLANGTLEPLTGTSTPPQQTHAQWGTVKIYDIETVPTDAGPVPATYTVSKVQGTTVTLLATVDTWLWGDVDHDADIDIDDILCMLAGFSGCFDLCSFEGLDLQPCTSAPAPSGRVIDVDDLLAELDAFSGGGYQPECVPGCTLGLSSPGSAFAASSVSLPEVPGSSALLRLQTSSATLTPGSIALIDVILSGSNSVRCAQISLEARDAAGNPMTVAYLSIDESRPDYVFSEMKTYSAVDPNNVRMVACLASGGVDATLEKYAGTFAFHVPEGLTGPCTIMIREAATHLRNAEGAAINVLATPALILTVDAGE